MPADPAAPVTEPRAELVKAGWRALTALVDDDITPPDRQRAAAVLAAVLPKLTLADLPAALLDGHEQQIRAKVAGEIEADLVGVNWSKVFRNGMEHAASIARGTEGGTR